MATKTSPSNTQRDSALAKANRTRSVRARLKVQVRNCEVDPAALLDMPECGSLTILDLLVWQRGVGTANAQRVLRRAGVAPTRPLSALTERERTALFGRDAA